VCCDGRAGTNEAKVIVPPKNAGTGSVANRVAKNTRKPVASDEIGCAGINLPDLVRILENS